MTVEIEERQKRESYFLKEVLEICRIDSSVYHNKLCRGEFRDFWRADNHKETIYEPGRRGRKRRPEPRFHPEHVEYMLQVVNGLMSERDALDWWTRRKSTIPSQLTARALAPIEQRKRGKKASA